MFSLILAITAILSAIALIPEVRHGLAKIPALCTPFTVGSIPTGTSAVLNCDAITGYGAVYRLCFATTMFYLLFTLIMVRVQSSKDPRSKIQNGFWFFKYLIWFGLVIGAFFIPVEGFTSFWMYVGMFGGVLFILIQLVLLVDFAHAWNESWLDAYEEGEQRYGIGLIACTLVFYIASLVGVGLLYHFYGGSSECGLNQTVISLNLIFCFILSLLSMSSHIREHLTTSGFLQSSVVTLYVMYLTWSGLSNGLNPHCNPTLPYNHTANNSTSPDGSIQLRLNWQVAVGLLFLILSVIYSSIRSSTATSAGKLMIGKAETTPFRDSVSRPISSPDDGKQLVWDDEEEEVTYNYSLFHLMLLLATLYVMVTLTNWLRPQNDLKSLTANWSSYWVRIVSSWVCLLLYLWTMVAPIVLANRDF